MFKNKIYKYLRRVGIL